MRKGQTDIDVVAGSKRHRELFAGECKWWNSFDAGKATQELVRRAQLISGYDTVRYGLFTKDQISAGFAGRLVQSGPSWMQRGSTKNEMASRRFKWAKEGNGRAGLY